MKLSKLIGMFAAAGMLTLGAMQAKAQGNVDDFDFVAKVELSGTFLTQNANVVSGDTLKFSYSKNSFSTKDILALIADCFNDQSLAASGNYVVLIEDGLYIVAKNGDLLQDISDVADVDTGPSVTKGSEIISGSKEGKFSESFIGSGSLALECDDGESTFFDFSVSGGITGDMSFSAFDSNGKAKVSQSITGKNLVGSGEVDGDDGVFDNVTLKIKGKGVVLD